MNRRINIILLLFFVLLTTEIKAQSNKHEVFGLTFLSPDRTSLNLVYRNDAGSELLQEDFKSGLELGYAYQVFSFMSVILSLQHYSLDGYEESNSGKDIIDISGNRLLIGPRFQSSKEGSKFEFDIGLMKGRTSRKHDYANEIRNDSALETGYYLGINRTFIFGEYLNFRLGLRAMGYISGEDKNNNSSSGYVDENVGASIDLNLSYFIRF